ncbi:MAG TPA: Asp-tRNA(Asn)/Glu-tRNA(Gln) amidotransferase GatCAB subunit A [Acidobacteria bacterium]|nr:Asp-tRNA(Asn)/Glu-tRNA(Gln) amidotransferase GatCAB subunit A [Acidobacteriota bacterium]
MERRGGSAGWRSPGRPSVGRGRGVAVNSQPLRLRTIGDVAPDVASGAVSASALTEACLGRIAERDGDLNAFIAIDADGARAAAQAADGEIAAGRYRGPLHGIPISLKDLIDVAGSPTTAASNVRPRTPAADDAPVVATLRAAGAIVLGKCNLHEFAFGTTSEDSAFGAVHNPHDLARSPGGSSGGSAAAVADGMSYGSIGTDTGGSIRIPSAACGTVGLKPSYGELSCDGIVPLSRTLDHVGPLARSVADAWMLYDAMAGRTPRLPADMPLPDRFRLGVPRPYFLDRVDPEVRRRFDDALARLEQAGVEVTEAEIPHAGDIAVIYLPIVLAEGMAYHAPTLDRRPEDYTAGVRLRLEMGRYVLAEDYVRARRGQEVLHREVAESLTACDALILPTLAIPAPPLGVDAVEVDGHTDSVRGLTLRLTQGFNLSGHPAISLPCGRTPDGLPCAVQLVGRRDRTADLLGIARRVEAAIQDNDDDGGHGGHGGNAGNAASDPAAT